MTEDSPSEFESPFNPLKCLDLPSTPVCGNVEPEPPSIPNSVESESLRSSYVPKSFVDPIKSPSVRPIPIIQVYSRKKVVLEQM